MTSDALTIRNLVNFGLLIPGVFQGFFQKTWTKRNLVAWKFISWIWAAQEVSGKPYEFKFGLLAATTHISFCPSMELCWDGDIHVVLGSQALWELEKWTDMALCREGMGRPPHGLEWPRPHDCTSSFWDELVFIPIIEPPAVRKVEPKKFFGHPPTVNFFFTLYQPCSPNLCSPYNGHENNQDFLTKTRT